MLVMTSLLILSIQMLCLYSLPHVQGIPVGHDQFPSRSGYHGEPASMNSLLSQAHNDAGSGQYAPYMTHSVDPMSQLGRREDPRWSLSHRDGQIWQDVSSIGVPTMLHSTQTGQSYIPPPPEGAERYFVPPYHDRIEQPEYLTQSRVDVPQYHNHDWSSTHSQPMEGVQHVVGQVRVPSTAAGEASSSLPLHADPHKKVRRRFSSYSSQRKFIEDNEKRRLIVEEYENRRREEKREGWNSRLNAPDQSVDKTGKKGRRARFTPEQVKLRKLESNKIARLRMEIRIHDKMEGTDKTRTDVVEEEMLERMKEEKKGNFKMEDFNAWRQQWREKQRKYDQSRIRGKNKKKSAEQKKYAESREEQGNVHGISDFSSSTRSPDSLAEERYITQHHSMHNPVIQHQQQMSTSAGSPFDLSELDSFPAQFD